jgi:hypothetical protein
VSTVGFTDQRQRIRRVLENALTGCSYVASERDSQGATLLLTARRGETRRVNVRFRGVRESDASAEPAAGSNLRLRHVGSGSKFSILAMLVPLLRTPGPAYTRVTIEAGDARLDIVCQDAEWWEDEKPPSQT